MTGFFSTIRVNFFRRGAEPDLGIRSGKVFTEGFVPKDPSQDLNILIDTEEKKELMSKRPQGKVEPVFAGQGEGFGTKTRELYQAINRAEWGGQYNTERAKSGQYFFRTFEDPTQKGSSAYGPLQITGGFFASYFGDLNHINTMIEQSERKYDRPQPAKKFKEEFKVELLNEFMADEENQELMALSPILEKYSRMISEYNRQRNIIQNALQYSGETKKIMIDQIEGQVSIIFDKIMNDLENRDLKVFEPMIKFTPIGEE